jgi:hypothetical protein
MRKILRLHDEGDEDIDYTKVEYAIERKILEAPEAEFVYYIDKVGPVPPASRSWTRRAQDPLDIGNGDLDPEWGIDFIIKGGIVRYGPWADRQR